MNQRLNLNGLSLLSLLLVPALLLSTRNLSVIVIAFMFLISIYYLVKNRPSYDMNRYDYLVILSLSTYFLSYIPITIADGSTLRYFQGGIRLLFCIPIYFVFKTIFIEHLDKAQAHLSVGVIIGSFGALIVAMYQFFILQMPRVDGFLFSINFGYLACSLAFLALCLCIKSKYKTLLMLAFVAAVISTLLTLTRGAIVAIPMLLVFCAALNWKQLSLKLTLALIVSLLGLSLTTYWISDPIKNRVDYTVDEVSHIISGDVAAATSSGTRLFLWKAATEAFKQSPVIGLPYDQRETLNQQLYEQGRVNKYTRDLTRGHAHSQYFEMLASNGVLGIIAMIMMLVLPLIMFLRHYWSTQSIWGYTGAVFVTGFMIFGLTEVPLQANLISGFYGFMLATFFALIRIEKYNTELSLNQ